MRRFVTAALSLSLGFSILLAVGQTASANPLAGGGYSSSYAGESVFTNKAAGESGQFSVIFFNDGTQSWAPNVVGLLVCLSDKTTCNVASPNAAYASGWFSATVYATVSATVAPGQNGFFIYNFVVPAGTAAGTAATFNGDVGLIATGAELRPQGYFQINTTPGAAAGGMTISPTSASLPVGGQQQFTVSGAPAGSTVTWTVTGGCGAVTSSGLFAATATNSPTQPCSVVATAGGSTASAAITVFGPAASIACSADPTTITGNGTSQTVVTATLKDANGNTVSNAQGTTITFSNATPALLTPTASQTRGTVDGKASVTYTSVSATSGTAQISVSSANLTGCNQFITITAVGTATKTVSSLSPATIAADGGTDPSYSRLRIDVTDAGGSRVTTNSSTQISVSRSSGASVCTPGSFSGTVASGRIQFLITATSTPGTCQYDITTNDTTIAGSSVTLTTTLTGAPNKLAASTSSSPATVTGVQGACSPDVDFNCPTVTVTIQDASSNRETGVLGSSVGITATWDVSTSEGTGCPAGINVYNALTGALIGTGSGQVYTTASNAQRNSTSSTTGASTAGRAFFEFTSNKATAGCTITFTDGAGVSTTTATIAFTAGPANGLACSFSPNDIPANGSSTSIGTVKVVDQQSNATGSGSFSTSFSKTTDQGATTLQTSSPQTMVNGSAQFTVKSTTTPGTDTYTASAQVTGSTASTTTCQIRTVTP